MLSLFAAISNYPAGYFNAYKEMANDKSIDLVLHLGDYLYEYSRKIMLHRKQKKWDALLIRLMKLSVWMIRRRYTTYRSDQGLAATSSIKTNDFGVG